MLIRERYLAVRIFKTIHEDISIRNILKYVRFAILWHESIYYKNKEYKQSYYNGLIL